MLIEIDQLQREIFYRDPEFDIWLIRSPSGRQWYRTGIVALTFSLNLTLRFEWQLFIIAPFSSGIFSCCLSGELSQQSEITLLNLEGGCEIGVGSAAEGGGEIIRRRLRWRVYLRLEEIIILKQ